MAEEEEEEEEEEEAAAEDLLVGGLAGDLHSGTQGVWRGGGTEKVTVDLREGGEGGADRVKVLVCGGGWMGLDKGTTI